MKPILLALSFASLTILSAGATAQDLTQSTANTGQVAAQILLAEHHDHDKSDVKSEYHEDKGDKDDHDDHDHDHDHDKMKNDKDDHDHDKDEHDNGDHDKDD